MKTVTNAFKEEITKLGREIDFKFFLHTNDKIITEDGKFLMTEDNRHLVVEQFDDEEVDEIINAEDIYSVSIVNRGKLLSTMMKELDFEVSKDLRIGDVIGCNFGLKVNGDYEYIDYGNYMVYEKEFNEDTKTYSYVAYDRMLLTMQEVSQEFLDDLETRTLASAINVICGKVGLSYNATQQELEDYPNLSKEINEGTFTGMQMTYRDVLDMIAQALGLSMIVEGSYLRLKPLPDSNGTYVDYEIEGNTTRNGTPTPNEPVEIENVTGEIQHNGKTIDLGNIELCKIGEYQDKIYKQNNKWYIHKEIGKIILNGTNAEITYVSNNSDATYSQFNIKNVDDWENANITGVTGQDRFISSHFVYNSTVGSPTKTGFGLAIWSNTNPKLVISFPTNLITAGDEVNSFETWLSNNNVSVYYPLETAANTEITDTTLINQLNEAGIVLPTINEQSLKDTNVSFGEKYIINSIVLSRSEDNDNIYRRDEESIAEYGVHEYKIKDNLIMLYDDREDYIDEIFEQLNGLEYYINDFTSTGIAYLDWLDFYNVEIGDKTYKCLMLNDEINIEQGLEESIYSEMPEETVTNYKTSSKTDKEVSFIVDKQNGRISGKVSQDDIIASLNVAIEDGQGVINLKGNTVTIEADNFTLDRTGKVVADDITVNNGTFKGNINTAQDCTVGDNLYIGQSQASTTEYERYIKMTENTYLRRYRNTTYPQPYEIFDLTSNAIQLKTTNSVNSSNATPFSSYGHNTTIRTVNQYIYMDNSTISASTQIQVGSDERLKQNIKDVDVSWIDNLKVKEFEYIKNPDKKQIGLIAQDYENEEYSKYFLGTDIEGYYAIAYGNITNALIQYCQEMKKEINSLKEEIKQLKESDN